MCGLPTTTCHSDSLQCRGCGQHTGGTALRADVNQGFSPAEPTVMMILGHHFLGRAPGSVKVKTRQYVSASAPPHQCPGPSSDAACPCSPGHLMHPPPHGGLSCLNHNRTFLLQLPWVCLPPLGQRCSVSGYLERDHLASILGRPDQRPGRHQGLKATWQPPVVLSLPHQPQDQPGLLPLQGPESQLTHLPEANLVRPCFALL